jgi:hypothetical protein
MGHRSVREVFWAAAAVTIFTSTVVLYGAIAGIDLLGLIGDTMRSILKATQKPL